MVIGQVAHALGSYYVHSRDGYFQLSRSERITPNGGYFNLESLLKLKGLKLSDVNFYDGHKPGELK